MKSPWRRRCYAKPVPTRKTVGTTGRRQSASFPGSPEVRGRKAEPFALRQGAAAFAKRLVGQAWEALWQSGFILQPPFLLLSALLLLPWRFPKHGSAFAAADAATGETNSRKVGAGVAFILASGRK